MNPYFARGFILTVLGFYGPDLYSNRARVNFERKDASDATQSVEFAQRMLDVRTNGIRSDNELLSTLDKGTF